MQKYCIKDVLCDYFPNVLSLTILQFLQRQKKRGSIEERVNKCVITVGTDLEFTGHRRHRLPYFLKLLKRAFILDNNYAVKRLLSAAMMFQAPSRIMVTIYYHQYGRKTNDFIKPFVLRIVDQH